MGWMASVSLWDKKPGMERKGRIAVEDMWWVWRPSHSFSSLSVIDGNEISKS